MSVFHRQPVCRLHPLALATIATVLAAAAHAQDAAPAASPTRSRPRKR